MTDSSQALLALFGRLMQQRTFISAAMRTRLPDADGRGDRGQQRLLRLLAEQDGLTNTDIAVKLDIRPSSVSALVKKLEDVKFIERRDDPDDKRVSLIYLTAAGRDFIQGARQFKDEFSEACFANLSASEQAQLRDLLQKLLAGLEAQDDFPHTMPNFQAFMRQAQAMHRGPHDFGDFFGGPRR